jgi:glycosyltransferase involved in cell wall biosynthesis
MPLVSVIVPIYNVNAYLFQCVQSIVNQTYQSLEIILVNDGSTDNCPEICEYFRKSDNRIKVITKTNSGLVNARKSGIELAKGEFIIFVDGDDWLETNYIEELIAEQENHSVDVVIPGHLREFMGLKSVISNPLDCGYYSHERIKDEIFPRLISYPPFYQPGIYTYSWGKLFKRELAFAHQMKTPESLILGEDAAVVYPIIAACQSLVITSIAGYNYRQRPNSILKTASPIEEELSKLKTLRYHLLTSLSNESNYDFSNQVDDFIFAYALMRTGAFISDSKLRYLTQLPTAIPEGSKICLYNSGSFGQQVYKSITTSGFYEISTWIDEDYSESQLIGLPVVDPKSMAAVEYDKVVIAILDPIRAHEITQYLKSLGIAEEQVVMPLPSITPSHNALKILGIIEH